MEGRNCSKCKEYKALEDYYRLKKGLYGRQTTCKKCSRAYQQDRYYNKGGKQKALDYEKNNKDEAKKAFTKYQSKMTPGVYLIYTKEGRYVGQSHKIELRLWNHKPWNSRSPVNSKILKAEILEVVKDKKLREQREEYWIKKLNPELNKIHNTGR